MKADNFVTPTHADRTENKNAGIVVVFSNQVSLPWLRLLKRGFRHCFVLIQTRDTEWILLDPLSNRMILSHLQSLPPADLVNWYNRNGYIALLTRRRDTPKGPAPMALFTCVELLKRVLGIHAWRVQTPYQLYNYLLKEYFP